MHNLDRTTLESFEQENEGEMFLAEGEGELGELEGQGEGEGFFELEGELGELEGETGELEGESPFHEAEAMELASELLAVSSEQELNHFLGGLIKKAAGGLKKFAGSSLGRTLIGGLKSVAKKALPIAGAALGNLVAPGVGGAIGGKLAGMAGKAFGLELEGLSAEDREFEVAKQFVHLAGGAAKTAAQTPCGASPAAAAKTALIKAAKNYAPGLVPKLAAAKVIAARPVGATLQGNLGRVVRGSAVAGSGQRGVWVRRGRNILLLGA